MDQFSQVFVFTDAAAGLFGRIRTDLLSFAVIVLIGILLLFGFPKVKNPLIRRLLSLFAAVGGLGGSLFFILFLMVYLEMASTYRGLQVAYDQGMYRIAEGVVSVSHVQPPGCYETGDLVQIDNVEFEVNYCHGAPFSYSQSIANNGVLTDGVFVRVYYTDSRTILRVDVKQ